jgi:hypothetical protein
MSIVGKDGVQIGRIRRAGLGKVKAAALAAGRKPETVDRDLAILRAVANGTPATAAERCRVPHKSVWRVLRRYEGFALEILNGSEEVSDAKFYA